jgi:hypothetical protein
MAAQLDAGRAIPCDLSIRTLPAQESKKARRGLAGNRAAPQETSTCLRSLSQALVATSM